MLPANLSRAGECNLHIFMRASLDRVNCQRENMTIVVALSSSRLSDDLCVRENSRNLNVFCGKSSSGETGRENGSSFPDNAFDLVSSRAANNSSIAQEEGKIDSSPTCCASLVRECLINWFIDFSVARFTTPEAGMREIFTGLFNGPTRLFTSLFHDTTCPEIKPPTSEKFIRNNCTRPRDLIKIIFAKRCAFSSQRFH